jgi:tRNA threonylcarbamoyladenosine biosynthesis protein TsaB
MTLLAIDTSSAYASIALHDGRDVIAEETWLAHRRHDDKLFPSIASLLALGGLDAASVRIIAVAIGPGSFTGLRVGIAAAQGLARGSGAAVVGVETLDVIAHPFAATGRRVCAVVPAGRGEHYAAMYRMRGGAFGRTTGILVGSVADLARRVGVETLFAGEIDDATAAALRDALGPRALVPPPGVLVRRAGHLAEIGWTRAASGAGADASTIEPLYVRPPAVRGPSGALVGDTSLAPVASALRVS